MATLDELIAKRSELTNTIYSGIIESRFGERWIKYQASPDQLKALAALDADIAKLMTPSGGSMCNFGQFNG